jgi:hypothetical protein
MAQLTGMAVTLTTANDDEAGTDDHVYIGVVGTGGGREFPLDSEKEDFITGEVEKFALGSIWEGGFVDGATKFPNESEPGKDNDPALIPLDVDRVNFVYLRKQGDNTTDGDDAYKLKDLRVVLYGPATPSKRIFRFFNGGTSVWVANENGHLIYLQETREG